MATPDPWGLLEALTAARAEIGDLRTAMEKLAAKLNEEPLQPLSKILGISTRAALGRLSGDVELRGLGHRLGRRLMFRASEVRHLLATRARAL